MNDSHTLYSSRVEDGAGIPFRRVTVNAAHSYFVQRDDRWTPIAPDTTAVHPDTAEHVSVKDLPWETPLIDTPAP